MPEYQNYEEEQEVEGQIEIHTMADKNEVGHDYNKFYKRCDKKVAFQRADLRLSPVAYQVACRMSLDKR